MPTKGRVFYCKACGSPTGDEEGNHQYLFFHGVLNVNVPDNHGKYMIRPISGGVNPGEIAPEPMSFCEIECFVNWMIERDNLGPSVYPKHHPIS
jgi:hypothetical protein